MLTIIYQYND